MTVYARPQFWWRAAIVACVVAGLLTGEHRIVYYTAQSNIITLAYFTGLLYWMVKRGTTEPAAPRLRGAVTLWILITCLISHFLLNHGDNPLPGLADPRPATALTNWSLFLVHYVVPIMVVADWLAFGPRRAARWRDIPLWVAFPLGYGLAIEIRAALLPAAPVRYPYFFLNPSDRGYDWVAGQFLELGVIFAALAAALIGLDRLAALLTDRRPPAPRAAAAPGAALAPAASAPAAPAPAAPAPAAATPGVLAPAAPPAAERRVAPVADGAESAAG